MQKSLPRNIQTQYGEYSIPYVVMPDVITGFGYESGLYFYGLWAYDCCKNIYRDYEQHDLEENHEHDQNSIKYL